MISQAIPFTIFISTNIAVMLQEAQSQKKYDHTHLLISQKEEIKVFKNWKWVAYMTRKK